VRRSGSTRCASRALIRDRDRAAEKRSVAIHEPGRGRLDGPGVEGTNLEAAFVKSRVASPGWRRSKNAFGTTTRPVDAGTSQSIATGLPDVVCSTDIRKTASGAPLEKVTSRSLPNAIVEGTTSSSYETQSDHSYGVHPRGTANVLVERKGKQILVLSSYEPVDYVVTAARGAEVVEIVLNGYYPHTVEAPPGTKVTNRSGTSYLAACAYAYPGDSEGCATPQLMKGVEDVLHRPITSFAGCYHASQFVVHDDAEACASPAGDASWQKKAFTYDRAQSTCSGGARYVRYDPRYAKWGGVELCSPTTYKIFLGESADGVFHEIGDFAGHGQDHCELVNPTFTMPNEDEVTSGGCSDCSVTMAGWESPGPVPVYTRSNLGEPFTLQTWPEHNLYTSSSYSCGVAIPCASAWRFSACRYSKRLIATPRCVPRIDTPGDCISPCDRRNAWRGTCLARA
jgi:hypothetical protein